MSLSPGMLARALLALLACTAVPAAPPPEVLNARQPDTLLWSRAGQVTAPARALVATLAAAPRYGLSPGDYDAGPLASELAALEAHPGAPAAAWSHFDAALSHAALGLIHDLHFGRIDPRRAGFDLPARSEAFDAAVVLGRLAAGDDPEGVLAGVEPAYLHYRLLRQALGRYRELAAGPPPPELPAAHGSVKPGEYYAGAAQLRRRLAMGGELPPQQAASTAPRLDADLVAALRRFQYLHGLAEDGALGRGTLAALEVPFAQRVRQIELTLERWRWVPALHPPTLIVNIPQFRLFLIRSAVDEEADMLRMNVIVGQQYPQLHTPVFTADMTAVLFRPYWDVPPSIVKRELLRELRRDPRYLETHDMELVSGGGAESAGTVLGPTPGNLEALAAGQLRLRQRPGPDNALGLIKFVLPNRYDVYLHSTPGQRLFAEPRRAFSHGCIRVSDPVALAVAVLAGTPGEWTAQKIRAAMDGEATLRVSLSQPVHVLILYGTAVAAEDGTVHFLDDIYGQDRRLETLLGLAPVTPPPER